MDKIELLSKLVSFNTINDKDNKEVLDFIENYLKKLNFTVEKRDKYLIMSYGDNPILGFLGHSDTVEFISGWKTNPHELTEINNNLYGLGSADMKGGIASFLIALSNIDLSKLKRGIKVYITYDEEIGFTGVKDVVNYERGFPEYMIFGEPTNNIINTACKGLFAVKVYTEGIKVHSSTPDKGRSAISYMMKILTELESFYNEYIKIDNNDIYEVPYTTMNIGLINGGSAINSVSKECFSYIDFRLIDEKHIILLQDKLTELCNKYYGHFDIDFSIKPFDNDIYFIKEKNSAGFMTEASFIDESKRLILGPGPITAHEIDEHISIESFDKCIKQYESIINELCM